MLILASLLVSRGSPLLSDQQCLSSASELE